DKPAKVAAVPAVLGLSPGESRLSKIAEVIGAEKFVRLENGEEKIVYLSNATAAALGASEGSTVRVGGWDVQVAGIFSHEAFDRQVQALSGESLAPLRYSSNQLDASGKMLSETTDQSLDLGGGAGAAEASGTNYE